MVRGGLLIAIATVTVASPPAFAEAVHEPGRPLPFTPVRLSDERTVTRWAYAQQLRWARAAPDHRAPRITALRRTTEDGEPEVYLALSSRVGADGRLWVRVRLPRRPNGSLGWVRRDALGQLRVVRTVLEIDRVRLRATLRRAGRIVFRTRIGVGKPGSETPAGRFYVREKLRNLRGDPIYGPWALGTSAYSRLSDWPGGGVIGIHGTNAPELVPGRPSHGCVRMTNAAITRLAALLPLGTPIRVQ